MLGEHHELRQEFPEYEEQIHNLKQTDNHFKKLFDEHHFLNKEIRQYEEKLQATTDEHLSDLKKKRLKLRDSLYQMLVKAK